MDKLIRQRFSELAEKVEMVVSDDGINFGNLYAWTTSVLNLLQRVFGENGVHYRNFSQQCKGFEDEEVNNWVQFEICKGIFQSAKEDYEGGYLFTVRALITAGILTDDILAQATELLSAGYKDPACVLGGVALETALKELCIRNSIPRAKLDRMNVELCKMGIYNMGMQKQITAWAERRNNAAHGNWNTYTEVDVEELIRGVTRFVAEYL
jgi:hypothetical protein